MFLANQTRWEFIPSDEELISSDREPVHLCILSSYSIISNACINRCLVKTQPLDLRSLQIHCNGSVGLGSHPFEGAQSENRDPTIGTVCGKVACVMVSTTVCKGRIRPPSTRVPGEGLWWPVYCTIQGGTARWFTALRTSNVMCMSRAPIRGPTPANLVVGPAGP